MKVKSGILLAFLVFITLVELGSGFLCYSSLGTSKKWNDNGVESTCRLEAGAMKRKCIKFKTEARPGKVFRECDHVYEKLFGYGVMDPNQVDGCYSFDTEVNTRPEKGVYCICSTELCNVGTVTAP